MTQFSRPSLVLFRDGKSAMAQIYIYGGACLAGDPTAYVIRHGEMIWVKPGESVEFVEV
jgi:hypothetical protein